MRGRLSFLESYSFFLFSPFTLAVFTTRFSSLLFVNHRQRHVQIANAYTGSATVHCKYTQKCACVQERRRGTHARHTRTHCVQSPEQVHGANTTLGLCRRSSTPHDNPHHSTPHSHSKSPRLGGYLPANPLINTRRSTPARNTILRVLLPGPIFGIVHGVYRCAMRNSILRIRPFVSRILHGDSFQFFSFFEKNEDHRYNKIVRNFFNRFPKKLI